MVSAYYNLRDVFPKKKKLNPSTPISYLLIHKRIDTLNNLFAKSLTPQKINHLATRYKLTAAMVATIMGDLDILKKLHERGANLKLQDHKGWTVVHHAIVGKQQKIVSWLRGKIEGLEEVTEKISRLIFQNEATFSSARITYSEDGKSFSEINPAKFKELTGANYVEEYRMSARQLIETWKQEQPAENELEIVYREGYEDSKTHPADLYLSPIKKDDMGHSLESVGFGVFTRKKIRIGKVFGEYLGEIIEDAGTVKADHYFLDPISGKKSRNLGPMINHGPPNCAFAKIPNPDKLGSLTRHVIFALDDIPPHTQLLVNYGTQLLIDVDGFYLLQPKAAIDYFRSFDILKFMENLEPKYAWNDLQKIQQKLSRVEYIMRSKKDLLLLHCEDILPLTALSLKAMRVFCEKRKIHFNPPPAPVIALVTCLKKYLKEPHPIDERFLCNLAFQETLEEVQKLCFLKTDMELITKGWEVLKKNTIQRMQDDFMIGMQAIPEEHKAPLEALDNELALLSRVLAMRTMDKADLDKYHIS